MIDLIIFIYGVIAALTLLVGGVTFISGMTLDEPDDARWGARVVLAAPFWPVALLILLIIKAELFNRR